MNAAENKKDRSISGQLENKRYRVRTVRENGKLTVESKIKKLVNTNFSDKRIFIAWNQQ